MVALSRFVLALSVPAQFGSAIQLRPDVSAENCQDFGQKLCIDFGSSGAKFSICGDEAKKHKFPSNAAGAFATTAKMNDTELKEKLEQYLVEQFKTSQAMDSATSPPQPMTSATTCVQVCGGTAGNRFAHLADEDKASWEKFNAALRNFATIPVGNECRTFTGTEEANFEWAFTGYSPVFIGIGGASMQLHLPLPSAEGKKCPALSEDSDFHGGVGASKEEEFCEITTSPRPGGVLWSLLADQQFNEPKDAKQKNLHIFGGMNEVAARYYHILDTEGLLAEESIKGKELGWVHGVISKTALADPMWVAVLKSFHGDGCAALPESNDMVFLANPSLGQKLLNGRLLDSVETALKLAIEKLLSPPALVTPGAQPKSVRSSRVRMRSLFRPQRRRTEADVLHHAIRQMSAYDDFEQVAQAVASACLEAVKGAVGAGEDRKKYFTEFDSTQPGKLGFLCTVKLFSLSWMSTLAGHTKEPKDTTKEPKDTTKEPKDTTKEPKDTTKEPKDTTKECFADNFQRLLGARHMHGDWMSGALAQQAKAPEKKN